MRDLQADLEICNKATRGPWDIYHEFNIRQRGTERGIASAGIYSNNKDETVYDTNINNAEFIAQAREGWPHAINRAINAEADVELLKLMVKSITEGLDEVNYAILLRKENLVIKTENEWLKRALSDIEDWCVEFHETGPHDPDKALKIVMNIYDIAYEQLGDRTELIKQAEKEGE